MSSGTCPALIPASGDRCWHPWEGCVRLSVVSLEASSSELAPTWGLITSKTEAKAAGNFSAVFKLQWGWGLNIEMATTGYLYVHSKIKLSFPNANENAKNLSLKISTHNEDQHMSSAYCYPEFVDIPSEPMALQKDLLYHDFKFPSITTKWKHVLNIEIPSCNLWLLCLTLKEDLVTIATSIPSVASPVPQSNAFHWTFYKFCQLKQMSSSYFSSSFLISPSKPWLCCFHYLESHFQWCLVSFLLLNNHRPFSLRHITPFLNTVTLKCHRLFQSAKQYFKLINNANIIYLFFFCSITINLWKICW